ncbi:4-(cytidine 5'-diphospho)-2-C-methyl-D-erythritol kinase [Phaeobacter sp.]|uniref:4-(cytidine 5'-diphospho)-2-C-methyl-D-erythritol kinase n=1 Tax=Phaeobacter sp. TaxID=1902409 RepID=UPI0025D1DD78|nr:4-(cytidine 5'-diphospho)-2-C-methyl-D-erythritol kinase [Phaeobacter sp.]
MRVEAFAPAKINLTLHVTGQRADGYHLLDSLVVFADIGDRIVAEPASERSLQVQGAMADGVPADQSNLMWRAADLFDSPQEAALQLHKDLPAASGIGGGSSDAAATLRALSELWGVPMPSSDAVLGLGADVPVCLHPIAQRMSGIGEQLTPLPQLPQFHIVLVNPGVSVATPAIFRALERRENAPMAELLPTWENAQALAEWLSDQRNDLQAPAVTLAPEIGTVLAALQATMPLFSAMSGSGATCFGLYPSTKQAQDAAAHLRRHHADWWVRAGQLLAP